MCSLAGKAVFDKLGGKKKRKDAPPIVPGAPVAGGPKPIVAPVATNPGFANPIQRVPLL